jgi:hypothetical protein
LNVHPYSNICCSMTNCGITEKATLEKTYVLDSTECVHSQLPVGLRQQQQPSSHPNQKPSSDAASHKGEASQTRMRAPTSTTLRP